MRGPYQILLPLLGLFLVRVDLTDLMPIYLDVKVLKIYDGDTVLVGRGSLQMKVRFSRIDSPEKGQPFLNGKGDAGLKSKECLEEFLTVKKSYPLKIEKQDMYGRILGDVDGVSFKLVEAGCTTLYPYAEFSSRFEKSLYLRAFKTAKTSGRGLWKYGGFRQPKMWRKSSKRSGHRQSHRRGHYQKPYRPGQKFEYKGG
jgi:endonuclease YncB( thermonuclease family)